MSQTASLFRSIWPNDKPHVVINSFLVDSLRKLTIQQGTRVYMHGNSGLFVYGTLETNGTKEDSVVFQGDRLEPHVRAPGVVEQPGAVAEQHGGDAGEDLVEHAPLQQRPGEGGPEDVDVTVPGPVRREADALV